MIRRRGDRLNVRNWLYVEDFCRGISHVLAHGAPGEVYDVGGRSTTNTDLVGTIIKHASRRYSFGSETVKALGWQAQTDLDQGLKTTVHWYQDHPERWQPIRSGEYRQYYERYYGKALGSSS